MAEPSANGTAMRRCDNISPQIAREAEHFGRGEPGASDRQLPLAGAAPTRRVAPGLLASHRAAAELLYVIALNAQPLDASRRRARRRSALFLARNRPPPRKPVLRPRGA